MTVLGKVCAHWVVTGLPLLILSPLVALLLSLDMQTWLAVAGTLLLGTPTLSLIGAIGVGLTVGLRKGGVLLSLLVLPLYIPLLIFATGAIDAASMGMPIDGYLAILGAMLAGSVTLAPFPPSAMKASTASAKPSVGARIARYSISCPVWRAKAAWMSGDLLWLMGLPNTQYLSVIYAIPEIG